MGADMKKIASVALVAAGLSMFSAKAGEVGLLLDKQVGASQDIPGSGYGFDSVKPSGIGIRGAFTLLDLKVAELGLTGTYHPEASGDLVMGPIKLGKFKEQYVAIGVQADWKFLVNLHAGLDLRRESLKSEISIAGYSVRSSTTTVTRPWLSAGIGFSVPMPVVSPFVRLEAAYALKTYSLSEDGSDDDFNKAMAPKYQIALYGGIRF
jgi:hypothetical protein